MRAIQDILDTHDDLQLCNSLYVRILRYCRHDLGSKPLSEHEQVVAFVWYSFGIIEIGSFNFLFDLPFLPDPDFTRTAQAYERIGCNDAGGALVLAFAKYSESTSQRRVVDGSWVAKLRNRFVDGDVTSRLAEYIRQNRGAFAHLG